MNRQYLKTGDKITFENNTFEIVKVIGAGANCLVYEVIKKDNEYTYKYYLKECYPFDARITRKKDGVLEWTDNYEKEKNLKKFKDAYKTLLNIYNDESFRNSTSMPLNIFETNGTVYFLNDIKTGMTFEEDVSQNLSDILATVIALSKLIEKYHNAGYLHLDIKPENVFLLDETRELLVLFDVDSVASIDMLRNGEIKHISFSENYAAPEQKREKLSEINEQTDIYSIGATMFAKIMSRFVTALDRDVFANWNFDEISMFDGINPQAKNYIKEIFKKTLAVQSKKRYKNASELIAALEKVKDACAKEMYLTSDYPSVIKDFVGRKDELDTIKLAFEHKNNVVFLSGFGGIGKSELAKKYAYDNSYNYDVILFCKYNESLKKTLNSIPIGNELKDNPTYKFCDKETVLNSLLNEKVLLIIDNFNVDVTEDEYLCELSKYKANIIITTRTDFSLCRLERFEQINISTIDKVALKNLFIKEIGYNKISAKEEIFVDEILSAYKYHTLFVRPLAYKIKYLGYTIEGLKDEVNSELLEDDDFIVGIQNNRLYEETLMTLAEKLFKIDELDEAKKQILSDLYMLGNAKINPATYVDEVYKNSSISGRKQIRNILVGLIRTGLIQKDELKDTLEIHDIIATLIHKKINPDISDCHEVAVFVHNKTIEVVSDSDAPVYGDEDEMSLENLLGIISRIDINNESNRKYVINLGFDTVKSRKRDWILHLFGTIIQKIPDDSDNIKLLYLQFLSKIYTEDFFATLNGIVEPQKDLEEFVVNYIYKFYKEKNDWSEMFSNIFWKMILTFYSLLCSFECYGWDLSLYEKIYECITYQEEYGKTLYDYVFNDTEEDLSGDIITQDGERIDDEDRVFAPQYICEIYLNHQCLIKEFDIDTRNKNSFDIYSECAACAANMYRGWLDKLLKNHISNGLHKNEIEKLQQLYNNIISDRLVAQYKDEFLKNYINLFIIVDPSLEYQILLDSENENLQEIFKTIFHDKNIDEGEKNNLLIACMDRIVKGYNDEFGYKAQLKLLKCVSEYADRLVFKGLEIPGTFDIITKFLYAYLVTDINKFSEMVNRVINNSIEKISNKTIPIGIFFTDLISLVRRVNKCRILHPYICEYADEIYALRKETKIINSVHILIDCIECAERAYKETKDPKYKKSYNEYKAKLKTLKNDL